MLRVNAETLGVQTLFYPSTLPLTPDTYRTHLRRHWNCSIPLSSRREDDDVLLVLLGAIGLGLAIAMYLLFFCPIECR
jgi:hypothetical protein